MIKPSITTDYILAARQRANSEKWGGVSDAEVLGLVNAGVQAEYDAICAADSSYYQLQASLSFDATGTATLPTDLARIRGLSQFPGTPRERLVYSVAFADRGGHHGKTGYYLGGNTITVTPIQEAARGPWGLYYTPLCPVLGVLQTKQAELLSIPIVNRHSGTMGFLAGTFIADDLDPESVFIATDVGNNVVVANTVSSNGVYTIATVNNSNAFTPTGSPAADEAFPDGGTALLLRASRVSVDGVWTLYGDTQFGNGFTQANVGDTLIVVGTALGNDGGRVITGVIDPATVTTTSTGLTAENFGNITVTLQPQGTVNTLDTTLSAYSEFPILWAAIRILQKKKQPADTNASLLATIEARIAMMAPKRVGEPEVVPVLWSQSFNPYTGWVGGGGFGGDW